MHGSSEPHGFLEDRPALWPHGTHKPLPPDIEQRLVQAMTCPLNDRDRAILLSEEALSTARDRGEDDLLALTLYHAARVARRVRRPDRAHVLCIEAQPMLERHDDRWLATCTLLLRGQCLLDVGEHERALALMADAAERFRLMEDQAELARSLAHMAEAHRLEGDLDKAIARAESAVAMLKGERLSELDISCRHVEASLRLERGRLHEQHGDMRAAQREYVRALAVLPSLRATVLPHTQPDGAKLLDTVVQIAVAIGDKRRVVLALRCLAGFARRCDTPAERGLAWLRLAEFQRLRGRRCAAVAGVRRAVGHLRTVPLEPQLVAAQLFLARLLEDDGDLKGAYEAYVEGLHLESEQQRDSIALRAELLALDLEAERELRRKEQTLAYAQRLSNVGHLAARVNHELNQPMASIRMLAETSLALIEQGKHEEVATSLQSMLTLSHRLTDLTSQLAAFPAQSALQLQPIDLHRAIAEALAVLRSRLSSASCEIVVEFTHTCVNAHEGQLVRVIVNLVNNALDALEAQANARISFGCRREDDRIVLSVADNGPGLAPAVLERLFQPFFSTKPAGRGLGLGLALSRDVIREMGGDLTARNAEGGGAVFDLSCSAAPGASG